MMFGSKKINSFVIFFVGVGVLLLGAFFLYFTPETHQTTIDPIQSEQPGVLPEKLVLVNENYIDYYQYNQDNKFYEKYHRGEHNIRYNHRQKISIVTLGDKEYIWSDKSQKILRYTPEQGVLESREFGSNIAAVASYGGYLYVCAEGAFFVLDKNLEQVRKLDLGIGRTKDAHDIIIHNNIAYLLDNIMYPVYILKVDISQPTRPRILDKTKIEGVNQHLTNHWLDLDNNQWAIVQVQGTMSGSSHNVFFYPSDKNSHRLIGTQNISRSVPLGMRGASEPDTVSDSSTNQENFSIYSVTEKSPVWATVNMSRTLAEVIHEPGKISLGEKISLKENTNINVDFRSFVKKRNGFVYAVHGEGNDLMVVDINNENFEIIIEQSLDNVGSYFTIPYEDIVLK